MFGFGFCVGSGVLVVCGGGGFCVVCMCVVGCVLLLVGGGCVESGCGGGEVCCGVLGWDDVVWGVVWFCVFECGCGVVEEIRCLEFY